MILNVPTFVSAQNFRSSDLDVTWKWGDTMKVNCKGPATFSDGSDSLDVDLGNRGWPQNARMVAFKF